MGRRHSATRIADEAAIKAANLWSGRSTLALAIGIQGEYALLPFLEKKRWHLSAKIFFAVLVVASIVGEYEFSSQISQSANELQRISDGELKDATDKAGRAIERASKADERSKTLESSNLKLRKDIVDSEGRLVAKQVDLEKAQKETAVAEKAAIDTQRQFNGAVVTRLLDRHVDARLEESLKSFPPAKAVVRVIESEPEAVVYALEIRNVLNKVGWNWRKDNFELMWVKTSCKMAHRCRLVDHITRSHP